MATPAEDDDLPDESVQSQSPISLAAQVQPQREGYPVNCSLSLLQIVFYYLQVLDILALHLPPDKIFTPVVSLYIVLGRYELCRMLLVIS